MKDPDLIREMQRLAEQGQSVARVLQLGADRFGPSAPAPTIANLVAAFDLAIPAAKRLVSWRGFSHGTLSDDAVEEIAGGLLLAWRRGRSADAAGDG
jgi:hypothetical protein